MFMKDEWSNKNFAKDWDSHTSQTNPIRQYQVNILVNVIATNYRKGESVADLGFGSGQVEEMLYKAKPNIDIVGIDDSQPMIDLAKKRLGQNFNRLTVINKSLEDLSEVVLPQKNYQYIFSVQTLHHLNPEQQKNVFKFVYNSLKPNGVFLLNDRVGVDFKTFYAEYKVIYETLKGEEKIKNNLSFDEYLEMINDKQDSPAKLEEQIQWLTEAGFKVTCLDLIFERALLAAVKI